MCKLLRDEMYLVVYVAVLSRPFQCVSPCMSRGLTTHKACASVVVVVVVDVDGVNEDGGHDFFYPGSKVEHPG